MVVMQVADLIQDCVKETTVRILKAAQGNTQKVVRCLA